MKRSLSFFALLFAAFAACAQMGGVKLVEITDMVGSHSWEIVDADALKELDAQVKEEAKVFPALLLEAKKKWAAAKNVKGVFPASQVKPRKYKVIGQGPEEKLEAKKEKLETRQADKISAEVEKEEKRLNAIRNEDMKEKEKAKIEGKIRLRAIAAGVMMGLLKEKLSREVPLYSNELQAYMEELEFAETKEEAPKEKK